MSKQVKGQEARRAFLKKAGKAAAAVPAAAVLLSMSDRAMAVPADPYSTLPPA